MRSLITRLSRRRSGSAPVLFAIIACSFLLLSSVAFTPAAARQDDLTDDTTLAEETDIPEQAIIPESTEPVTTETPEDPELFWLTITKFDCNDPATVPYGSTTLADYQAACPDPMLAQFEAHNDYGYYDLQVGSSVTFEAPTESTMVSELIPAGYISPAIFCDLGDGLTFQNDTNTSVLVTGKAGDTLSCTFFNRIMPMEPEMEDDATPESTPGMPGETGLTIWKYLCPAGYDVAADGADPLNDCTDSMNGVPFTLDHPDAGEIDLQTSTGDSIDGAVMFGGIAPAEYTVIETPPSGIDSAFLWNCYNNGQLVPGMAPLATGFSAPLTIEENDNLSCNWFNVPEDDDVPTPEPGTTDLYIYKYTCPAGYDLNAAGADPLTDCATPTNGITFVLTDDDPATVDLQTDTGDSVDGAVSFGGLQPGNYTITETVPADIASVFVLDCENALDGMVRPTPFATGNVLNLPISGYEGTITCHWFNVPADPHGTLTVVKYSCTTEVFVSDVDCEILETGQGFDLLWWNGASWDAITYGITDANGQLRFTGLESGSWWLEEHNQTWCHLASDQLSDDGTSLTVEAGAETVVKVYNCGAESTWSTPTKYPNTGIPPVANRPATT